MKSLFALLLIGTVRRPRWHSMPGIPCRRPLQLLRQHRAPTAEQSAQPGTMDHSQMDHSQMETDAQQTPIVDTFRR